MMLRIKFGLEHRGTVVPRLNFQKVSRFDFLSPNMSLILNVLHDSE